VVIAVAFSSVTGSAKQLEVAKRCLPPTRPGEDVIYLKASVHRDVDAAVLAIALRGVPHLTTEAFGSKRSHVSPCELSSHLEG
jgi:hypothetical protein